MKVKRIFLLAVVLLSTTMFSLAQTSKMGFSFQGYAVGPDGKALGNTNITVKFTVYGSGDNNFTEEQKLKSDAFGVFHAIIGNSSETSKTAFSKINFNLTNSDDIYNLKVEVKETSGGTYATISDAQMNAVPYARYAFNGVPVGTIVPFAGKAGNIPYGWLLCDGKSLSKDKYPQLYNIIGTIWGGGGSSFNVPDLREEFLRGASDTIDVGHPQDYMTAMPRNKFETSSAGEHNHTSGNGYYLKITHTNTANTTDTDSGNEPNIRTAHPINNAGAHIHTITGGDKETRPRNKAVNYIIKY